MAKGISGTGAGFDAAPAGKVGGRFHGHDLNPAKRRWESRQPAEDAGGAGAGPTRLSRVPVYTFRRSCPA